MGWLNKNQERVRGFNNSNPIRQNVALTKFYAQNIQTYNPVEKSTSAHSQRLRLP